MTLQLTEEQAWDEYVELQKAYNKIISLKFRLVTELNDWIAEETEKYEKAIAPLMPYVRDRIMEELELRQGKYGEERREMGQE